MLDWFFIFCSGALGSSHCVGMCGGIVVTIGATAPTPAVNVGRQLIYTAGRLFTYSFLGGMGGFAGWRLTHALPTFARAQAVFAMIAGAILVVQGLATAGALRWSVGCASPLLSRFFAEMFRGPGWRGAFLAGVFTGFLPCALVYGFLALAVSSSSPAVGSAIMFAFGLGTAPMMLLAGCGGGLLGVATRRRWLQVAAGCVVIAGAISIGRGAYFILADPRDIAAAGFSCGPSLPFLH